MSAIAPTSSVPTHAKSSGCPFAAISPLVGRWPALLYGAVSYLAFLGSFLYAIGFVGNWLVPKTIDSGAAGSLTSWEREAAAVAINTAWLAAFVLQHTIMARPAFKRWWTRFVPVSIERSTYVLAASLCLIGLFVFWRPLPGMVWQFTHPAAVIVLSAISLAGWALVLLSSFVINHFDLFGLRQVWLRWQGKQYTPVDFQLRGPYRIVRHPLMLGFLIAFWVTPAMSVGHLFFAVMTTGYIFMGLWFEERDLIAEHGESYLAYRRSTRGLIPLPRRALSGSGE